MSKIPEAFLIAISLLLSFIITVYYTYKPKFPLPVVVLFVAVSFCIVNQGDVSETVRIFFEQSRSCPPAAKSLLTIQEVDEFLTQLSKLSKEEEQQNLLQEIASR